MMFSRLIVDSKINEGFSFLVNLAKKTTSCFMLGRWFCSPLQVIPWFLLGKTL